MPRKYLIIGLTLVAFMHVRPVKAQGLVNEQQLKNSNTYSITPRQLVSLASQGQFKAQGIASRDNFRHGVKTGKITAQELIESAISSKRLSENVRSDRNYLKIVSSHLKSGGCGT